MTFLSGESRNSTNPRALSYESAMGIAADFLKRAVALCERTGINIGFETIPEQYGCDFGYSWPVEALAKSGLNEQSTLKEVFADEISDPLAVISIESLLSHCSGLPAWRNFWICRLGSLEQSELEKTARSHAFEVINRIDQLGKREDCYSDIGYLLLGFLIEETFGANLSDVFESYVDSLSKPDANWFFLNFPRNPISSKTEFVPSGYCGIRKREIIGEVHDENAAALGGICGHAGLFGTGESVSWYLKRLWSSTSWQAKVSSSSGCIYGLRKGDDPSSCVFGEGRGIGHLGFTGGAFWLDPKTEKYGILLTNRIISSRVSGRIKSIRREVFKNLWKICTENEYV